MRNPTPNEAGASNTIWKISAHPTPTQEEEAKKCEKEKNIVCSLSPSTLMDLVALIAGEQNNPS